MERQLFTARDIHRLYHQHKPTTLVLSPVDLITPEAVDLARALHIQIVREGPQAAEPRPPAPDEPLPPLKVVSRAGVTMEAFGEDLATPGASVRLKDVITSKDGAPMAAGYMAMEKGEFPWTLTYSEIDIVLEGELVITRGSEVVRGGPGDCIFIPKGSSIHFGTPSYVRFVYVTYPADWNAPG